MAILKCSGVPVAKISIGLPTEAPGKSLLFNSSATGPSSLGTIAKFFPFNSGKVKIQPTVVNSPRE